MIRRCKYLLAAGCLLSMLGPVSALAQQPGVDFAVEPGPKSQTAEGGGYFLIRADAGQRVGQSLNLRNESDRPLTLKLAAVDATTGQLGGVSYGLPDDPVERMGGWVSLDRTAVTLEPGEARAVRFEVSVPRDVSGGQHIAGIAVWALGDEAEDGGDEAVSVVVRTRRIVAVQVDVPGPQDPELVVTGVEPAARPDGLYLEIQIENQGSAMTTGDGTLEIPAQAFVEDFFVDTFVPGTSIGYPIKWTDDPREGVYDAHVEIDYEGRVAEWTGSFTVGDPVIAELQDRGVDVPGGLPVVPIATTAALLGAVAVTWWILRRRRGPAFPPAGVAPAATLQRPAGPYVQQAPPPPQAPPLARGRQGSPSGGLSGRRSGRVPPPPPPPRS